MAWQVTDPAVYTKFDNGTFEGTITLDDAKPGLINGFATYNFSATRVHSGTLSFRANLVNTPSRSGFDPMYEHRIIMFKVGKALIKNRRYTFTGWVYINNKGNLANEIYNAKLAVAMGSVAGFGSAWDAWAREIADINDDFGVWKQFSFVSSTPYGVDANSSCLQFYLKWVGGPLSINSNNVDVFFDDFTCVEETDIPPIPLSISYIRTNVTINGGSNGTIDVTVSGGSGNYSYQWSDGPITQDRNNLPAGTYTIVVTDSTAGLTGQRTIQISEPARLNATFTKTDATTNGGADGTITVFVGGGSGNYTYLWNDAVTTQNRTGLIAGVYSVDVRDITTGELVILSGILIEEPAPPVIQGTFLFFPELNPLTFVNEQVIDVCANPQALDNVLLVDQIYPGYEQTNYFQKVCQCDNRMIQFNSDFDSFTITLHEYIEGIAVKTFIFHLREQNLGNKEVFPITIRTHAGFTGKSRVYFDAGPPPIPLKVGDNFTILNNADGFNGAYKIVEILNDTTLGYQYLVINKSYTAPNSTSSANGEFYTAAVNFNVYESILSFDGITEGCYYVRVVATNANNTVASRSEPIDLKAKHEGTNLMTYRNFDNDFNTTWTTGFVGQIRVESLIGHKRNPGGERSISRNSNYSPVKLSAKKTRGILFESIMLPPYMHEKLSLIFDLDFFTINGVQFQATEGYAEPAYIELFLLASSSIRLEQINWMDKYNSDDIGSIVDVEVLETDEVSLLRTK